MLSFSPYLSKFVYALRWPGPSASALCEPVAVLLSRNMTCTQHQRNATPSEHFLHTSPCTLHTLHFPLHASHFAVPSLHPSPCSLHVLHSTFHRALAHLISALPTCAVTSFTQQTSTRQAFTQISFYTQQTCTQRYTEQAFPQRKCLHTELLHAASFYTRKSFTHCKLLLAATFYERRFSPTQLQENRNPGVSILRAPAQSKCTWTCHKSHCVRKCARKMPNAPNTGPELVSQEPFSVATPFGAKRKYAPQDVQAAIRPTYTAPGRQHARYRMTMLQCSLWHC